VAYRVRYSLRTIASTHPAIYLPIARRKHYASGIAVTEDTELVIEGVPRSGNTFAVVAFEFAQRRPIRMAHHLHAAAQVVEAARMRIPILLLTRDPDASAISHVLREPRITMKQALMSWIRFYERVLPYKDAMVISDFELVTTDFGRVIEEINRRFGTEFEPFEHTDLNVTRCFEVIDERHRAQYGAIVESHVSRPSAPREQLKEALSERLGAPPLSGLRRRAHELYRRLLSTADVV
jgi:hypothetical protein